MQNKSKNSPVLGLSTREPAHQRAPLGIAQCGIGSEERGGGGGQTGANALGADRRRAQIISRAKYKLNNRIRFADMF